MFEQIGVTGKGTEYMLSRHIDANDANSNYNSNSNPPLDIPVQSVIPFTQAAFLIN